MTQPARNTLSACSPFTRTSNFVQVSTAHLDFRSSRAVQPGNVYRRSSSWAAGRLFNRRSMVVLPSSQRQQLKASQALITSITSRFASAMLRLHRVSVGAARQEMPKVLASVLHSSAKPVAASIPLSAGITIGGFAGVVSALSGVGGGIILIPAFAKLTSLPQQVINGTSLAAALLSASIGAYNHLDRGACSLPIALATTIPSVVFARFGVRLAQRLTSNRLSIVGGGAMLLSAPLIFLKSSEHFPKFGTDVSPLDLQLCKLSDIRDPSSSYWDGVKQDPAGFASVNAKYLAAGMGAGFISGLCGLGGGILVTAFLTAATDMPQEDIIGTSFLGIVPTATASTYCNVKAKAIHLSTAARVGGSLVAGAYVTSKYVTHDVPDDVLRIILGSTLTLAALATMRRSI